MDDSFAMVAVFLKLVGGLYLIFAIGIIIYGLKSVFTGTSRVFGDDDSNYGYSKGLTAFNSFFSRTFSPGFYHRVLPHDSTPVDGDTAGVVGWAYVVLGLLILAPLMWGLVSLCGNNITNIKACLLK